MPFFVRRHVLSEIASAAGAQLRHEIEVARKDIDAKARYPRRWDDEQRRRAIVQRTTSRLFRARRAIPVDLDALVKAVVG